MTLPQLRVGAAAQAYFVEEAHRATQRAIHIAADVQLLAYERCYLRDLPAAVLTGEALPTAEASWDPYPCSVAARSLALAVALGRSDYAPLLQQCATRVLTQLEFHLMGNHLLENAIGIGCAGSVLGGVLGTTLHQTSRRLLQRELAEQFLPDGGHFERSASYHNWLTAALLELWMLEPRLHRLLMSPLSQALSWTARTTCPDGTFPLFSDASLDGCVAPSTLLAVGRELGFPAPAVTSCEHLAETGWVLVRHGRLFLAANVGEIQSDYIPGHAHADSLSFELWADGQRVVVDPGVGTYQDGRLREWCRSTAAHSTVTVDGADSTEVWSAFRVGHRPNVWLDKLDVSPDGVEIVAHHDGYARAAGAPRHCRRWRVMADELEVDDLVTGDGVHSIVSSLNVSECFRGSVVGADRLEATHWFPEHGNLRSSTRHIVEKHGVLPMRLRLRVVP